MTKRQLVWVGAAVCLALAVWYATRPHPVSRQNYERIRKGMTRAEVEAIFRCPPGDYSTLARIPRRWSMRWGSEAWISNEGVAWVWFDDDDRVSKTHFETLPTISQPHLLDRVRAWLGW